MKRIFALVTMIAFLITSTGVVVTQARCKMTGTIMNSCCANDDGSCCTKELHAVKIQDRYMMPATIKVYVAEFSVPICHLNQLEPPLSFLRTPLETDHSPPPSPAEPSFLQVFLI